MKIYYPKDKNGNQIGFRTPESYVFDKSGKSLTDKLAELNSNISNSTSNYATKQELQVQTSRIDTFTTLNSGSTTGDAELIDIRVGYDGKKYENAGNSVREQIRKINENSFDFTTNFNKCNYNTSSATFYYKSPIKSGFLSSIKMKVYKECTNILHLYDESKYHIKQFELKLTAGMNTVPINTYIAEDTYISFEFENISMATKANSFGVTWGVNGFDDTDTVAEFGISFLYKNINIKNTHILGYDNGEKLIIDTKKHTLTLKEETSFVCDSQYITLSKDTINYTCNENNADTNQFRSIFLNTNTKELYVSLSPNHSTDLYLCGFNDKGELVGNTNCVSVKHTKVIMIGDSYAEGYNPDSSTNVRGWCEYLKIFMGLSDDEAIVNYLGGCGFANAVNGKTFKTLLEETVSNVINANMVEKIIVCGGCNDISKQPPHLYAAMASFLNYAVSTFPNATVYVGMIAYSTNSSNLNTLCNTVLYTYQRCNVIKNCTYLPFVEYALNNTLMASDGKHPTQDGEGQIAMQIKQALNGASFIPYHLYNNIRN